jgi:hypothetical protein
MNHHHHHHQCKICTCSYEYWFRINSSNEPTQTQIKKSHLMRNTHELIHIDIYIYIYISFVWLIMQFWCHTTCKRVQRNSNESCVCTKFIFTIGTQITKFMYKNSLHFIEGFVVLVFYYLFLMCKPH